MSTGKRGAGGAFWRSLRGHPGLGVAACFSLALLGTLLSEASLGKALAVVGILLVLWGVVLTTAWQQRGQYKEPEA